MQLMISGQLSLDIGKTGSSRSGANHYIEDGDIRQLCSTYGGLDDGVSKPSGLQLKMVTLERD